MLTTYGSLHGGGGVDHDNLAALEKKLELVDKKLEYVLDVLAQATGAFGVPLSISLNRPDWWEKEGGDD
jgi:hypothetical protein